MSRFVTLFALVFCRQGLSMDPRLAQSSLDSLSVLTLRVLLLSPECQGYRCSPPHPALTFLKYMHGFTRCLVRTSEDTKLNHSRTFPVCLGLESSQLIHFSYTLSFGLKHTTWQNMERVTGLLYYMSNIMLQSTAD